MENYLNYLEYLRFNGGWFKMLTKDYNTLMVGYVSKVSLDGPYKFFYLFDCPVVFSGVNKRLYTDVRCVYEEEKNFLEKPTIEDIKLIEDKLNKGYKKFNIKTKKILEYESD